VPKKQAQKSRQKRQQKSRQKRWQKGNKKAAKTLFVNFLVLFGANHQKKNFLKHIPEPVLKPV